MRLRDLLSLHDRALDPEALEFSLGDGVLLGRNPVFRRVRRAVRARGFGFAVDEPAGYFGFPLISLDAVLTSRVIPHRDNVSALRRLESEQPGELRLADFRHNRPTPNYVLHESAHAIAFDVAFSGATDAHAAMSDATMLPRVMVGESFAMTAEYLAACCLAPGIETWLFSISSYRRHTPQRAAIGRFVDELGLEVVARLLVGAFLHANYLVEPLRRADVDALLGRFGPAASAAPSGRRLDQLRRALAGCMVMSREFRAHTARLFLVHHGLGRRLDRWLGRARLAGALEQPELQRVVCELAAILASPGPRSAQHVPPSSGTSEGRPRGLPRVVEPPGDAMGRSRSASLKKGIDKRDRI